ncbi:hypothetical protein Hanom_Chr04g00293391 [Helianthus anomalus]
MLVARFSSPIRQFGGLKLVNKKCKLQVLSFVFTPNYKRCPLAQKLISFVLYVSKSCTVCPLSLTQLDFLIKYDHVPCT